MSTGNPRAEFLQSAKTTDTYRFIEVEARIHDGSLENPFTDARLDGSMEDPSGGKSRVEGFCDSQDGSVFRIRFMPRRPGRHSFSVAYRQPGGFTSGFSGTFMAVDAGHKGVLRSDPQHPWHFLWEGTGEHYFLNGTTCYYLMGFEDEEVIRASIDRLHGYRINRIRVLLYGRQFDRPWGTPVVNGADFRMALNPWVAKYPEDTTNPGFDLRRFNVAHWRKYERLLEHARDRDMIVSVIFFIGAQPLYAPFMEGSEEEYLYYRYAVARLSAFSNITWDLANEHDFHRNTSFWPYLMGSFLEHQDPVGHLCGCHNKVYLQPWYTWLGMQLMQSWDSGLHAYVLEHRKAQAESGRIIPQVIEEYGYESHHELFSGHRSPDTRRRCAWEVAMAGGYQTTGEKEQSGGGWVNGRGDDGMTMLGMYAFMVDFFESFKWWKTEPHDELVLAYEYPATRPVAYYDSAGNRITEFHAWCLAEPGACYVFYLPAGGSLTAELEAGDYSVRSLNPRDGTTRDLGCVKASRWASPPVPDEEDWAFLLVRK